MSPVPNPGLRGFLVFVCSIQQPGHETKSMCHPTPTEPTSTLPKPQPQSARGREKEDQGRRRRRRRRRSNSTAKLSISLCLSGSQTHGYSVASPVGDRRGTVNSRQTLHLESTQIQCCPPPTGSQGSAWSIISCLLATQQQCGCCG